SPWFFWDGRRDSQWAQALGPLENPLEHGMDRDQIIELVSNDPDYSKRYTDLFGPLPKPGNTGGIDRAYVNLGKAIAAYERRILPGASRFDRYAAAILNGRKPIEADRLSNDEEEGLRAFIADNQGNCISCHSGPLLTDNKFHNIGIEPAGALDADLGRLSGYKDVISNEFNCRSSYSGIPPAECPKRIAIKPDDTNPKGAFRTPSLRNVSKTAPYMHAGQYETLDQVIWHYREPLRAKIGKSELEKTTLTPSQFEQILTFLLTLDSPTTAPAKYLRPPDFY
ncbi:MAG: cytochrome-c peroxidase, partial [Rhodospirillales bacterium]|nr:cytochrome-c peroxidase [Rhodospirillales bacterium]